MNNIEPKKNNRNYRKLLWIFWVPE